MGHAAMSRDEMTHQGNARPILRAKKVEQRGSGFVRATDGKCKVVSDNHCTCKLVSLDFRL